MSNPRGGSAANRASSGLDDGRSCEGSRPSGPQGPRFGVITTPVGICDKGPARPATRLTRRNTPPILPATSRRAGCERDEYPSRVGRETRWLVETGAATTGNGPGSLRTEREAATPQTSVGSGAERQRYRAAPIEPGPRRRGRRSRECGTRRMRVAPRKARPFVPGRRVVSDSRGTNAMTTARADSAWPRPSASPPTPTRSCCAPRARPTSRRRSVPSCASTTAARPTSSSRSRAASGSAATPSSASGRGACSRCATASPASRPGPSTSRPTRPDLPIETDAGARPARRHPARSSRAAASSPTEGMPRFTGGAVGALAYDAVTIVRADRPAAGPRPGRRPDGRVHRDRPRPRLRPPDPHAVGDRLAAHRGARPRGPLPDRRGGDLRGARADRAARAPAELAGGHAAGRATGGRPAAAAAAIETSLGREAVHPRGRGRQGRHRGRRGDPGRARAAPVVRPAGRRRDRRDARRDRRCIARSGGSTRARTCSSSGRPRSRSSAPRRSCSSRSRATS